MKFLRGTFRAVLFLLTGCVAASLAQAQGNRIFYIDTQIHDVFSTDIDSHASARNNFAILGPDALTIDPALQHVIFYDRDNSNTTYIDMIDTDLGYVNERFEGSPHTIRGIAVDPVTHNIFSVHSDGTLRFRDGNLNSQTTLRSGLATGAVGMGIAIDHPNNRIYFTDGVSSIYWTALNGTNFTTVTSGLSTPYGLALDHATSTIYFDEIGSGKIRRVGTDGSNLTDVATGFGTALGYLAVDSVRKQIYFADRLTTIKRINYDGTGLTSAVTGINRSAGVDLLFTEPEIDIHDAVRSYAVGSTVTLTSAAVNNASDTSLTLENIGYADLHLSGSPRVVISGPDANAFSIVQQPAATLSLSTSTTLGIHFAPTSAGVKNATLNIANDDSNESSYTIHLQAGATVQIKYIAGAHGTISGPALQTLTGNGDTTPVVAVADVHYHFTRWEDNSTSNPRFDAHVTTSATHTASFAIDTLSVNYVAGAHGSISGTSPQTIDYGSSTGQVLAVPATGYHFVDWDDLSTVNPRSDSNVTTNGAHTARFAVNVYTVAYVAGAHGIINGSTPQSINHGGATTQVTAQPAVGYNFADWNDLSTVNPRSDSNVTTNATHTARFTIRTFTVDFTSGAHGSLSGTASQVVNYDASSTQVLAVPAAGYHFVQWSDNDTANPRIVTHVTANFSAAAQFAINQYTLTYSAGSSGTLTGQTSQTVNYQSSGTQVTAVPNVGAHFAQWSDSSTQNPRVDGNVTTNVTVSAQFLVNIYTARYSAAAHGSITGPSMITVYHGGSVPTVTAVPDVNYHFTEWSDHSAVNPRTDTNVTSDITVTADFAITTYTLTYATGANGTLSGQATQVVNSGTSGTAVSAVPDAHHHFVKWSDNVTSITRVDDHVTTNITVTAVFAADQFTLNYVAGVGGSISGAATQSVDYGTSGTAVLAVPDAGYRFVEWNDTSTQNPRTDANVATDQSVSATFMPENNAVKVWEIYK